MPASHIWQALATITCRPPRDVYYNVNELLGGSSREFNVGTATGIREDHELTNKSGQALQLSIFWPNHVAAVDDQRPCVVYCHCNTGSRRSAEEAVYLLLSLGVVVATVDFAGAGLSEGEWVTMGVKESEDVDAVVEFLRATGRVATVGLWGRSSGAVAALLSAQRDPTICGLVLDSTFGRLRDLVVEIPQRLELPLPPGTTAAHVAEQVKAGVQRLAGFDIEALVPLEVAPSCSMPALFGHSSRDELVKMAHTVRVYDAYGGAKDIITFDGSHYANRPVFFYYAVLAFFCKALAVEKHVPAVAPLDRKRAEQAAMLTCQLLEDREAGLSLDEVFLDLHRIATKAAAIHAPPPSATGTSALRAWQPYRAPEEAEPEMVVAPLQPPLGRGDTREQGAGLVQLAPESSQSVRAAYLTASGIPMPRAATGTAPSVYAAAPPATTNTPPGHPANIYGIPVPFPGSSGVADMDSGRLHPNSRGRRQFAAALQQQQQQQGNGAGVAQQGQEQQEVYHMYPPGLYPPGNGSAMVATVPDDLSDSAEPWLYHSTTRTPRGSVAVCEYAGSNSNKKYRIRKLTVGQDKASTRTDTTSSSGVAAHWPLHPLSPTSPSGFQQWNDRPSSTQASSAASTPATGTHPQHRPAAAAGAAPASSSIPAGSRLITQEEAAALVLAAVATPSAGSASPTSSHHDGVHHPAIPAGSHPGPPSPRTSSVRSRSSSRSATPKPAMADLEAGARQLSVHSPASSSSNGDTSNMPQGCLGPLGPSIRTASPRHMPATPSRSKEAMAWPNWYMRDGQEGGPLGSRSKNKIKWKQHACAATPYGSLICEVSGNILRRRYRWRLLLAGGDSAIVPNATTSSRPALDLVGAVHRAAAELPMRRSRLSGSAAGSSANCTAVGDATPTLSTVSGEEQTPITTKTSGTLLDNKPAAETQDQPARVLDGVKLYAIPGKPGVQVTEEVLQLYKSLDRSTLNGLVKMYSRKQDGGP